MHELINRTPFPWQSKALAKIWNVRNS